jgi:hypothetical protein
MRLPILLLLAIAACSAEQPNSGQTVNRDTLTQRQKDSILANSRIPGASGVKRAMAAADSTSARAAQADAVARDTTER